MIDVKLKDYLNRDDVSLPDVGRELYGVVESVVGREGEHVRIDMLEVVSLPSSLLNTFLGDLIKEYGFSILGKIIFKNITKMQADRLVKYVDDIREVSGYK